MKTTWTGSVIAVVAAVVLVGAGIAHAKHDESTHEHGSHGHGGPHGGPGDLGNDGHGHGGDPGTQGTGHGQGNGNGGGQGNQGGHGNGGSTCDAASSAIGAFVDTTCPCAGVDDGNGGTVAWKNHGQYVRCVAHAIRDAVRAAGAKRRCARDLMPCAAQSSCGKKKAVTCLVPAVGTCTAGVCSNAPDTTCAVDADCTTKACAVTSAAHCDALGGTAGSGSCCTASPSGAFVGEVFGDGD
jgi:hypothetical protein